MAPEDLGAGAVSPGVVCPGVPESAPHTTKSRHGLPASSPGQGPTQSASTLTAPSGTSSAHGPTQAGMLCGGVAPLPSSVCAVDAYCTCSIYTYGTTYTDSPSVVGSWNTTVRRDKLGATYGATRDVCRGITRRTANRRVIGATEVGLLSHTNHFLTP
jgi:hypothetical protein